MRALGVFPRKRKLELVDLSPPRIEEPDQVLLRVLEVGICGTDREIASFEYGAPPPGAEFLVLGHEALGEVVEVGPAVTAFAPGDLAVPLVRRPCPHARCPACRSGRPDFCYTGDFQERGIKEAHGFLTSLIVDREAFLEPVPRRLREVGVLVEPLTVAEKAFSQARSIQERLPWKCRHGKEDSGESCHNAVVLGAGPVGILGAMSLLVAGFRTWVYSRDEAGSPRARLVESLGAAYLSTGDFPLDRLQAAVGNIDLVYEAAGASRTSFELLSRLGTNGIFIFTGVPGRGAPAEIDTDLLMRNLVLKNQVVLGTVNADREAYRAAVRDLGAFLDRWPDAVRSVIAGRHGLDEWPELIMKRPEGIKHLIAPEAPGG